MFLRWQRRTGHVGYGSLTGAVGTRSRGCWRSQSGPPARTGSASSRLHPRAISGVVTLATYHIAAPAAFRAAHADLISVIGRTAAARRQAEHRRLGLSTVTMRAVAEPRPGRDSPSGPVREERCSPCRHHHGGADRRGVATEGGAARRRSGLTGPMAFPEAARTVPDPWTDCTGRETAGQNQSPNVPEARDMRTFARRTLRTTPASFVPCGDARVAQYAAVAVPA